MKKKAPKVSRKQQFDSSIFIRVSSEMLQDLSDLADKTREKLSLNVRRSDVVRHILAKAIEQGVDSVYSPVKENP